MMASDQRTRAGGGVEICALPGRIHVWLLCRVCVRIVCASVVAPNPRATDGRGRRTGWVDREQIGIQHAMSSLFALAPTMPCMILGMISRYSAFE